MEEEEEEEGRQTREGGFYQDGAELDRATMARSVQAATRRRKANSAECGGGSPRLLKEKKHLSSSSTHTHCIDGLVLLILGAPIKVPFLFSPPLSHLPQQHVGETELVIRRPLKRTSAGD